jgi:hypothetical protein
MNDARHFLLTRFYLEHPGTGYDGTQQLEWLEERLRLFELVCYPSVMRQTVSDFTWMLACRRDVPERYRRRLAAFQGKNVTVTYENRSFAGVEERLGDARYLVTSRLDNDDAICPHYIERVQSAFRRYRDGGTPTGVFSLSSGLMLALPSGGLYRESYPTNPFLSLFVDLQTEGPTSVYERGHNHLPHEYPTVYDDEHVAWLRAVHGGNVSTRLGGEETDLGRTVYASADGSRPARIDWGRVWECQTEPPAG